MSSARSFYLKLSILILGIGSVLWSFANPAATETSVIVQASSRLGFESPQVHPLAVTPDGTRLLAVNTPAGRLSVFDISNGLPNLISEIPVGLEPVSVAARNDNEAWVVNWLSDSVSVVNLTTGNVVGTIDVGDEPTDVVFAGKDGEKAFVCVSGLAQVKVFNASMPATRPQEIDIRGKQPRSLSRDRAGERVFVSVFESGNQTTIVSADKVKEAGGPPKPKIKKSKKIPPAPETGLIVKWNGAGWADDRGNTHWSQFIPYTLADVDLVIIDASAPTPQVAREVRGVGTHVGNAAYDAQANRLYIANLESHNEIRFEPALRGRFQSQRVSILDLQPGVSTAAAVDLNPHIDFNVPEGSKKERQKSLALPSDIARGADGTIYVAAMGSAKIGVLDPSGNVRDRINVGQGPTGLALDEARGRLFVLNRFDNSLSVIDTATRSEIGQVSVGLNPEPVEVIEGRRFLYDATLSAHGQLACASCHLNGHRDGLAWDLGDPKGMMERVGGLLPSNFHPMKGPMTTQSLRGITGNEPLHWRGDRGRLSDFNQAFVTLLGGPRQLTSEEMGKFEAFIKTLSYPPNPLQNLDRTLPDPPTGPSAARGQRLFTDSRLDAAVLTCDQCHTAGSKAPGTNNIIIPGLVLQESQDFKVPQLRGMYQKFGMKKGPGEQLSGFGYIHDGSIDTLLSFLRLPIFTFRNDDDRLDVEEFLVSFDSGVAPAVGLQVTVNGQNKSWPTTLERINLLIAQAEAGNCELIVRGIYKGARRGFAYTGKRMFLSDRAEESSVSVEEIIEAASTGAELTFTGVPVGSARLPGID